MAVVVHATLLYVSTSNRNLPLCKFSWFLLRLCLVSQFDSCIKI